MSSTPRGRAGPEDVTRSGSVHELPISGGGTALDHLRELVRRPTQRIRSVTPRLAVLVATSHGVVIGFGWEPAAPSGLALATLGVDGFFVISGFLVARSHERLTLPRFAWHRFLRIMPGFWVCLVVTAFVVAPIAALLLERPVGTILRPPESALTHPLANLLLATPQTGISGLLTGNPAGDDTVHVPLWSLPFEAACYGLLVLLAARAALRRRRRHVLVLTVVLLGLTVAKECGLPVTGSRACCSNS